MTSPFTVISISRSRRRAPDPYTGQMEFAEVWIVKLQSVAIEGRAIDYICENEQESQRFSEGQIRQISL